MSSPGSSPSPSPNPARPLTPAPWIRMSEIPEDVLVLVRFSTLFKNIDWYVESLFYGEDHQGIPVFWQTDRKESPLPVEDADAWMFIPE